MRGSAAFRTGVAPGGVLAPAWVRDALWRNARAVPSLDLNFAANKSLVDATTRQNLVTFTRSSSGTYVGSDGVLKTATTNLLLRSEEFDNASWATKALCTISQDSTLAPNGTTTADTIVEDTTTGFRAVGQNFTAIGSTQYTISCYVKAATRGFVRVYAGSSASWSVFPSAVFNLSTGTVDSGTGFIISVGSGWYRCSVTGTFGGTGGSTQVFVGPVASSGASNSYLGTGATAIYIWGAQLEQSSTVGEYIPTTSTINSAPRFDHNPTTGESLGLLVEEQRTNLLLYSACDSNWVTGGFGTATYNLGLSALGVFSGVQIASAGQNWHSIYRTGISLTASTVYAFTLFYRAGTSGRMRLTFRNNTTTTETLVNGSVGNLSVTAAFAGAATIISQYLCSDGLTYVVTGTFTPNSTSADHWYRIGPDSTTSGQTVIALGGQLEAGAFPTSYIPTTTATATRSADVASITGTNFSSWYSQSEGTVFADTDRNTAIAAATTVVSINDNTTNNRLLNCRQDSSSQLTVISQTGGTLDGSPQLSLNNTSARNKVAAAQALNNLAASANGGAAVADTSVAMPTVNQMQIGNVTNVSLYNGTIRRLVYWGQRLPNSVLQAITQ